MAKKLYVGGLSYGTTEGSLKEAFSAAGTVESVAIITDKMTGKSKGFGFVEMSSEAEAQKAIEMFNGKEFEGRNITVNEARPLENRSFKRGSGFNRGKYGGFRGGRKDNW
jgi:RNA recognition motif-containing protein